VIEKTHGFIYDEKVCLSMVDRLADYSQTLTKRERSILVSILISHLEPIERRRWLNLEGLVNCEEKALLKQLKEKY
jgi:hypothetical protein